MMQNRVNTIFIDLFYNVYLSEHFWNNKNTLQKQATLDYYVIFTKGN